VSRQPAAVGASAATADNTVCANAIFLTPDGSMHDGNFTTPTLRWFRFVGKTNRSYAIVSENLSPTDVQAAVGMVPPIGPNCMGANLPNTLSNDVEPVPINPGSAVGAVRRTLVLAADTEVFFRINGDPSGRFRIRVEETTMFSPAFSTNGTFNTFYSLQNTANVSINGTLSLFDTGGSIVDTVSAVIPGGGTLSTNTAAMATLRNQTGVAVFTHDGPARLDSLRSRHRELLHHPSLRPECEMPDRAPAKVERKG
jgi:hypothetical protein